MRNQKTFENFNSSLESNQKRITESIQNKKMNWLYPDKTNWAILPRHIFSFFLFINWLAYFFLQNLSPLFQRDQQKVCLQTSEIFWLKRQQQERLQSILISGFQIFFHPNFFFRQKNKEMRRVWVEKNSKGCVLHRKGCCCFFNSATFLALKGSVFKNGKVRQYLAKNINKLRTIFSNPPPANEILR